MGKRIISRRRGAGGPVYRSPSHKHKGEPRLPRIDEGTGTVVAIEHAPGRSGPIAWIDLSNGEQALQVATEGMHLGQTVIYSTGRPPIARGNTCPLGSIPEGTPIHCVEGTPGDGGQYVRSGGNAAYVVSHAPKHTTVLMPSGKTRSFNPSCRATIGLAAGGGFGDKPFLKAGKKHHRVKTRASNWPKVRGVAMNPVDHPHGGGAHNYSGVQTSVKRGAPPGRKVGKIAPKQTGKR